MSELESTTNTQIGTIESEPSNNGLRPTIFLITVLLVLLADQISKAWMVRSMVLNDTRPIFGQAFRLTLTHNTGGAWGTLPRGNGVFTVFAAVAIVALVLAYQRVGRQDLQVGAAFALAMGGAAGNLSDRIRLGYVVDFFDARIIHWPIFNIADSAITISILVLVWHFLRPKPVTYHGITEAEIAVAQPDSRT